MKTIRKVARKIIRFPRSTPQSRDGKFRVVYYPAFDDSTSMADHLNRARWYLPGRTDLKVEIWFRTLSYPPANHAPPHSPLYPWTFARPRIARSEDQLAVAARNADLVLVWRSEAVKQAERIVGFRQPQVVNVDIHDVASIEYGSQAVLRWRFFLSQGQRTTVLNQSRDRLKEVISSIPADKRHFALVMGTGPSFSKYQNLSRKGGTVIASNSAVHDTDFLESFRPDFLVFGDAAHHVGPSHQAAEFRDHLLRALELLPDLVVVTNARYFGSLEGRWGSLTERVIWVDQTSKEPVSNLIKNFSLPRLDSVMNILMLPLATTVSKKVFIIGADGFLPKTEKNDDFWGHSDSFDYFSRIRTLHQAHPTYEVHRKQGTRGNPPTGLRHNKSVSESLTIGEGQGLRYYALMPSSIPAFADRLVPPEVQQAHQDRGFLNLRTLADVLV